MGVLSRPGKRVFMIFAEPTKKGFWSFTVITSALFLRKIGYIQSNSVKRRDGIGLCHIYSEKFRDKDDVHERWRNAGPLRSCTFNGFGNSCDRKYD